MDTNSRHARRLAALALLSCMVPLAATAAPARSMASAQQVLLATPDQVEAERILIGLLRDPDVLAAQARVKAELAQSAIGKTIDGAARIAEAVRQWTGSLTFKELLALRAQNPAILWGTDDTPRTWLGHTLPGVGTSGDNPDHIYRSASVDGGGQYEITGKFDPKRRPAQFVISSSKLVPEEQMKLSATSAGLGGKTTVLSDRDIPVASDGSFRVTVGGEPQSGTPHIPLESGTIGIGFRDVLSDWNGQQPARLAIRRLDKQDSRPLDAAMVKQRVLERLGPYVRFWSAFPVTWFGGLKPNTISGPSPREGGWGYLAGLRFQLQPDEAILVRTGREGAQYNGIQVVDPWMIAPDGKEHLTSLNPAQARADADGSFTFIIAPSDPGVANWLDTGGLHDGFAVLRWQNLPAGSTGAGLLREFKVIKLADARKLPGVAQVTPAERRAQVAEHARSYALRAR